METRYTSVSKPSPLPADYLKMVHEVFHAHFSDGLVAYGKYRQNPRFDLRGEIGSNEVVLAVSLLTEGDLAAVTVYGSMDFEPKASLPTIQDLLAACVDAIGTVFETLLPADQPTLIQELAEGSLMTLKNVPLEWTELKALDQTIYVKADTANLTLDVLSEEWLKQNDPDYEKRLEEEQAEVKKRFVTGKLH